MQSIFDQIERFSDHRLRRLRREVVAEIQRRQQPRQTEKSVAGASSAGHLGGASPAVPENPLGGEVLRVTRPQSPRRAA